MFKTHLREVYIMMILCDTELRTSVLLKKGQTAAAGKKVGLPRFSCGTSKFEGRKSGTSWVWKLMEVLSLFPKPQKLLDPYQTLSGQG